MTDASDLYISHTKIGISRFTEILINFSGNNISRLHYELGTGASLDIMTSLVE